MQARKTKSNLRTWRESRLDASLERVLVLHTQGMKDHMKARELFEFGHHKNIIRRGVAIDTIVAEQQYIRQAFSPIADKKLQFDSSKTSKTSQLYHSQLKNRFRPALPIC
jgi:hypothetical protein